VIDLSTHPDSFLISASDGLWDRRRQEFFANQFSESFVHKKTSPAKNLFDVMVKIIPKVKIGYLDDITAIVIKI
jgi:serine/threonine protein phosphatase PrpC